jgi:hypothetical protein
LNSPVDLFANSNLKLQIFGGRSNHLIMVGVPLYFEGSWAILSTIGLINVMFGLIVVGIAGLSPIALVPIILSIAGAVANGLCFYAFYGNYNKTATLIAAIFADLGWLV